MKRVRYLAGAVGIAPIAAGALVAGTGPAAAEVASHGKTVSLHAASGHMDRVRPHISEVPCLQFGFVHVYWLDGFISTCFANGGAVNDSFPVFVSLFTGNNGVSATLKEDGRTYYCNDKYKSTWAGYGSFKSTHGHHPGSGGTLTRLHIYAGTGGHYGAGTC